jgi:predicted nucleic acid-binding protein
MPASGVIELADANLWLALAFSDHAHHGTAKAWFDAKLDGTCAFCRVTQMALLRHLANSGSPSHALRTDAFLAALAIERHTRLVTFDQGCRRFAALDLLVLT